jgi:lysine-N-methylase
MQNEDKPVNERLSDLLDFAVEFQNEIGDCENLCDNIDFVDVFNNPELINPEWQEKVKNYKLSSVENTLTNENIACYFIYKYFLDALDDFDFLSKAKMAVIGVLINTYFGNDSWTMHLWSKETEHSQYNMDRYKKLLKTANCLSVEQLKQRLKS